MTLRAPSQRWTAAGGRHGEPRQPESGLTARLRDARDRRRAVRFKNSAGQAVGSTYQRLIPPQSGAKMSPNEIIQAQSLTSVDNPTVAQVATYNITLSWTSVACQ